MTGLNGPLVANGAEEQPGYTGLISPSGWQV